MRTCLSVLLALSSIWLLSVVITFNTAGAAEKQLDVGPLMEDLERNVVVLDQPIYVWHWFNGRGGKSIWSQRIGVDDPAGYEYVVRKAKDYFRSLCPLTVRENTPGCDDVNDLSYARNSWFGPGLYMATDPVATEWYGRGDGWVLVKMRIPNGFRIWDLSKDSNEFSQKGADVLKSLGCRLDVGKFDLARLGAVNGTAKNPNSTECLLKVRSLLKDDLKIQAIAYRYKGASFPECLGKGDSEKHSMAFVITDTAGIEPGDVRVYNAQTNELVGDRRLIETLFYYADRGRGELFRQLRFPDYPSYNFEEYIACAANRPRPGIDCGIKLCRDSTTDCIQIPEPSNFSFAGMYMGGKYLPQGYSSHTNTLLWSDLDGVEVDMQVREWLKSNAYGCQ